VCVCVCVCVCLCVCVCVCVRAQYAPASVLPGRASAAPNASAVERLEACSGEKNMSSCVTFLEEEAGMTMGYSALSPAVSP
jgi:hypothetical protein